MIKTIGYGATFLNRKLKPVKFDRAEPGPGDVELELLYSGVCHSDIHQVNNDWSNTVWPCVPGHEVVGRVARIGADVTGFKVGDIATVGCMIDSCGECYSCRQGNEQYCEAETSWLATYNGPMAPTGQNTYGGYSTSLVVKEHFLLPLPPEIPLEVAAPILCAGVTTYSPLKHWGVKPGSKVGIVGLGGLGHMAVQIAKAMGAEVTVITTSPEKKDDAFAFGASRVVVSSNKDEMKAASRSLDFILDTIPEPHKLDDLINLLHRDGALTLVGALGKEPKWDGMTVIMQRITIGGSLIGSIAETREVLEFCAKHKCFPRVEVIGAEEINSAYNKVEDKKARYRYVIDLASLKKNKLDELSEIPSVTHLLENKEVLMKQPEVHAGADRQEMQHVLEAGAGSP